MVISELNFPSRIFISGIDTDAGKSYATGWLARSMMDAGMSVITQKFVQTGNSDFSEDIDVHRNIMCTGLLEEDYNHLTAPEIFSYPCSPDLAAKLDHRIINLKKITDATNQLATKFDYVLIEGAGGLMVPLNGLYLTIDYIKDQNLPVAIVTNGRLGSINHTLLAVDALKNRNIPLFALIYNTHFDNDKIISADTKNYLQNWLESNMPETLYIEIPSMKKG